MNRKSNLTCFVGVLLAVTACAPEPSSTPEPDDTRAEDEAAVRALRDAFLESQRAGDAERAAAFYADDAIIMAPGEPSTTGLEAIRAGAAEFYGAYEWDSREPIEELVVQGDWGFTRTTWSATRTDKATGMAVELTGKAVHIYRRQPDGTWKIAIDIFNFDHPVDPLPSP